MIGTSNVKINKFLAVALSIYVIEPHAHVLQNMQNHYIAEKDSFNIFGILVFINERYFHQSYLG